MLETDVPLTHKAGLPGNPSWHGLMLRGGHRVPGTTSRWLLPVVLLSVFVMPISISGTSLALPDIAHSLGSDPTRLQWVINGFNVAAAIFMIIWGVVSDRIGYRFTFVLGVLVMLAANVVSLAAGSLWVLDGARILAGIGAAGLFAGAAAILSNVYEGAARGRAFALFGTTVGLGVALGPTLAGAIVSAFGWRGIFAAFIIVLAVSATGFGVLPQIKHDRIPGAKSVDFSLLRNKRFLAFALVPVAQAFGYVTLVTYLPIAFSAIKGLSAGTVGLRMLPATVPVLFGPIIAAQVIKRVSWVTPFTIIKVALVGLAIGDAGMLLLGPSLSPGLVIAPMILLGFGFGLPIGLVDGEALALVPARNSGTAAGVINFLRLGSEAIAVGAFAVVIAALVHAKLHNSTVAAITAAGHAGHGGAYASSLHTVVLIIAVLTIALTGLITVLSRSKQAAPAVVAPTAPRAAKPAVTAIASRHDAEPAVAATTALDGGESVLVTVSCWEGTLKCRPLVTK